MGVALMLLIVAIPTAQAGRAGGGPVCVYFGNSIEETRVKTGSVDRCGPDSMATVKIQEGWVTACIENTCVRLLLHEDVSDDVDHLVGNLLP